MTGYTAELLACPDLNGSRAVGERSEKVFVVSVDSDLCAASGVCARMAPDLFRLDDLADTAEPVQEQVGDAGTLARIRQVAERCPTWAIRWRDAKG